MYCILRAILNTDKYSTEAALRVACVTEQTHDIRVYVVGLFCDAGYFKGIFNESDDIFCLD